MIEVEHKKREDFLRKVAFSFVLPFNPPQYDIW